MRPFRLLLTALVGLCAVSSTHAQKIFQRTIDIGWGTVHDAGPDRYIVGGGHPYPYAADDIGFILAEFERNGSVHWSKRYRATRHLTFHGFDRTADRMFMVGAVEEQSNSTTNAAVMATDSEGNLLWSWAVGTTTDWESAYDLAPLDDGGLLIVGETRGKPNTDIDVLVARFDGNGNHLWTHTYDGGGDDVGRTVIRTPDGFIVAGSTKNTGTNDVDVLLMKISEDGTLLWSKTYTGDETGDDVAGDIVQTPDGGLAFVGAMRVFGEEASRGCIVRLDSGGAVQWSRTFGHPGGTAVGIAPGDDGRLAVLTHLNGTNIPENDIELTCFEADGTPAWTRRYGDEREDHAISLLRDDDGFLITGTAWSGLWMIQTDLDGEAGCSSTSTDAEPLPYTTTGRIYPITTETETTAYELGQTPTPLTIEVGIFCDGPTPPPSDRTFQHSFDGTGEFTIKELQRLSDGYALLGRAVLPGNEKEDNLIVRTDENGEIEWANTFGYDGWDEPLQSTVTSDGELLVIGYSQNTSIQEMKQGTVMMKISPQGEVRWTHLLPIVTSASICTTADGGFALAAEEGIVRMDSLGAPLWAYRILDSTGRKVSTISPTKDQGFIVTGAPAYQQDNNAIWLLRLDSTGSVLWSRMFTDTNFTSLKGIAAYETSDGGITAFGTMSQSKTSATPFLVATLHLDSAGTLRWARTYRNMRFPTPSIRPTRDGGFMLAGGTESFLPAGRKPYLLKVDSLGWVVWSRTFDMYVPTTNVSAATSTGQFVSAVEKPDGGFMAVGDFELPPYACYMVSIDPTGTSSCSDGLAPMVVSSWNPRLAKDTYIGQEQFPVAAVETALSVGERSFATTDLCAIGVSDVPTLPSSPTNSLAIRPNPVDRDGEVWISLPDDVHGPVTITVAEVTGTEVLRATAEPSTDATSGGNGARLDMRGMVAGTYLITVRYDVGTLQRLVVVR